MIVWGRKRKDKTLGYAAEFCPFCREIKPVKVIEERMIGHIYGIGLGSGDLLGYRGICDSCKARIAVSPYNYSSYEKQIDPSIDRLISNTNPGIHNLMAERLEAERIVQSFGTLDQETRSTLIDEPFNALVDEFEKRGAQTQMDWKCGISLAAIIVLPIIIAIVANDVLGIREDRFDSLVLPIMGYSALLSLIMAVYFIFTTNSRYNREFIYPLLGRSLKPLDPTLEELSNTLDALRQDGFYIGKKLKARTVFEYIQRRSNV